MWRSSLSLRLLLESRGGERFFNGEERRGETRRRERGKREIEEKEREERRSYKDCNSTVKITDRGEWPRAVCSKLGKPIQ